MTRPRAADDFPVIRARIEELRRERVPAPTEPEARPLRAATSAPAKFGIRPCGGNGKRATPSALSLFQTHCRAALLSAKSRAMTESGAARPGDSQGRNLLQKNLGEILASQTLHSSI